MGAEMPLSTDSEQLPNKGHEGETPTSPLFLGSPRGLQWAVRICIVSGVLSGGCLGEVGRQSHPSASALIALAAAKSADLASVLGAWCLLAHRRNFAVCIGLQSVSCTRRGALLGLYSGSH